MVVAFNRTIAFIELISPVFIFDIFFVYSNERTKRWIFFVFTIILIINMRLSYMMADFSGGVGLRLSTTDDLSLRNSFANIYSLTILSSTLFLIIIKLFRKETCAKNKIIKIGFLMVFIGFIAVLVFRSYFMTAVILLLVGFIFALFYGKKYWILLGALSSFVLIFLFLSSFDYLVNLSDQTREMSAQITPKLYELRSVFTGEQHMADDFSSRQDLTYSSITTFLQYPLGGVLYMISEFEDSISLGVGNHAEWFDMLARYGLFSILLFYFLFQSFKDQKRCISFGLHYFLYLLLGFLNPVLSFYHLFVICVYIPLLYSFIFNPNNQKYHA